MIVLLVHLGIKPGLENELKAKVKEVVEATRKEPGCISYHLLQDPYVDNEFYFIEEWQSVEALHAHRLTPHFIKWGKESTAIVAQRVVKMYDSQEKQF